jgi:GT2 family glycosyltransferase
MSSEIKFSLILPVCHGGPFLLKALESLRGIEFPPEHFEVLVVGDDDDKVSRNMVETGPYAEELNISYISSKNSNRSAKLNAACSLSRGQILVFSDDDCIFLPDWLQTLTRALERHPDIGVIGGQDEPVHNGSPFGLALDCVLNSFFGTGGLRGKGPSMGKYYPKLWNMAIPREVAFDIALKNEGGSIQIFNESLIVHEDVDLGNRVERSGRRIVFSPEVRVRHCRDTTFLRFVRRNVNMASTSRALGIHRLTHLSLAVFALSAPALAMASVFVHSLRTVVLILFGMYTVILIACALRCFRRTGNPNMLALVPGLMVSLHLARGLGYLLPLRRKLTEVVP